MSTFKKMLVFTEDTPKEQYDQLFTLEVGRVFKVKSGYETVMLRIEEYKPKNKKFEVTYISPGTSLYIMYGPDHCIVTENSDITG